MSAWFKWKGVSSSTYGIHVLTQPSIIRPNERVTRKTIPGRPGSLTFTEGTDIYEDILLTVECYIENANNINSIFTWLKGSGTLEISNRSGGHYNARVNAQIQLTRILYQHPHMSFSIVFRCNPYWYYDNISDITLTSSGTFITNPGGIWSEPVIKVNGSGQVTLVVGSTLVELSDVDSYVTIDSVAKEAYKGTVLKNSTMSGDFPTLAPGSNAVTWVGSVTSLVITPNWRTL